MNELSYDVVCPYCGAENKGLYLAETDGMMECDCCHEVMQVIEFEGSRIPISVLDGYVFVHHSVRS